MPIRRPAVMGAVALLVSLGCAGPSEVAESIPPQETDPPERVERFCGLVADLATLRREYDETVGDQLRAGEHLIVLQELQDVIPAVLGGAPPSIAPQMITIKHVSPDAVKASDLQRRDDADAVVDQFVADRCDVVFTFEGLDFTAP